MQVFGERVHNLKRSVKEIRGGTGSQGAEGVPIGAVLQEVYWGEERGGGITTAMHDRSRPTIGPRIPTMPGQTTSGFHRPGRLCLHQTTGGVIMLTFMVIARSTIDPRTPATERELTALRVVRLPPKERETGSGNKN